MPDRLTIVPRYTGSTAASALRITLEPEYVDRRAALADLADVDAMLAAVRSGASARGRQLDRCRWATILPDGRLRVTLRLYVWPSDSDIPYTLSAPEGVEVGVRTVETRAVNRKFWVSGEALFDLPWLVREPRVEWVPGLSCFDAESRETDPPNVHYVAAGARVAVRGRAYGLLAVSGTARGFVHEIAAEYEKFEISADSSRPQINNITADDIDVTCAWPDESGETRTTTARLAIPACVKTLLTECSGGRRLFFNVRPASRRPTVVYYNTCDGSVLSVRRADAGEGRA